jgi:hypothetical protein
MQPHETRMIFFLGVLTPFDGLHSASSHDVLAVAELLFLGRLAHRRWSANGKRRTLPMTRIRGLSGLSQLTPRAPKLIEPQPCRPASLSSQQTT